MLLEFVVRNFTDLGALYTHGNFDQGFVHSDGGWGMGDEWYYTQCGGWRLEGLWEIIAIMVGRLG